MSNRLPETDLANWSFMPTNLKRSALEGFERPKAIQGSYEPFRQVFPDAINQQFPLFGETLIESDWSAIERRLVQACKGNAKLIKMNREILAATFNYAKDAGISAGALDVRPLRFFGSTNYFFGLNVLIRYKDKAVIVFLDMRRTNGLNSNGRNFVFSALHHRFREAYPDLANAGLEIWRYKKGQGRLLVPFDEIQTLYSWNEMVDDVLETHAIWDEVKRGVVKTRPAAGDHGPLFGRLA